MDKDYRNVLSYSESQMLTLCNSNTHKIAERSNYSFLRPTNSIYVDFSYSDCLQANYIAFQNTDYSSKWFFAWIDEVIYKSDSSCEIKYTIDAWSTWFDKWTKKACYVIREHVNDDTIGLHTVDENLNVGEVVCQDKSYDSSYTIEYGFWVAITSDWIPNDNSIIDLLTPQGKQYSGISVYNGSVFGNQILLFEIIWDSVNSRFSGYENIQRYIERTNNDQHIGDVRDMFIIPDALIKRANINQHQAYNDLTTNANELFTFYTLKYNTTAESFDTTITKVNSGLNVVNNKCYCYPYNYLLVSNNSGTHNIFKYEDFSTSNCVFKNQLAMSIGVSGRLVPENYKGMSRADDESLPLGKYPTCGWSADSYTNWLTSQSVNMTSNFLMSTANAITNPTGLLSVAGSIGNIIGQFHDAMIKPNIQGSTNTGNVQFVSNRIRYDFYKMCCKPEYMAIIDNYFSRFGYKINKVKQPNITGRRNWNYVEIASSDDIGYGTVPANFMSTINNACRNGVTIWHSHDNLGNYSLANDIL